MRSVSTKFINVIKKILDNNNRSITHRNVHIRLEQEGYQDLVLEIHGDKLSLAHYFESNGDLVPDPDILFHIKRSKAEDGEFDLYPLHYQNSITYQRCAEHVEGVWQVNTKLQNDLCAFCTIWANNIKEQGWLQIVNQKYVRN
jgi:hypothetical protein